MIAAAELPSAQLHSSPSLSSGLSSATSSTYHYREEPVTKNHYEARVFLVVVFGFGLLDAIMRQGLPSAAAGAAL